MLRKITLFVFLGILTSFPTFASHLLGGELKMWNDTTAGTNVLKVELRLLRDVAGINLDTSQKVLIFKNGVLNDSIQVSLSPGSGNGNLISTTLQSIQIEQFIYTGFIVPQNSGATYRAVFDLCCRPGSVTNIGNSSAQGYYIFAELDLSQGYNSELPVLASLAAYAQVGYAFAFSNFTIDADNDSLSFTLETPLNTGGLPMSQYWLPYTGPTNPIPFQIDSQTGLVQWLPEYSDVNAYRIKIVEYRKDSLGMYKRLATHNKDLAIIVLSTGNNSSFALAPVSGSTTLANGAKQVEFIGQKNNQLSLSFSGITTSDFEVEVFGGPFSFDAQNTSLSKDSLSATTCDFILEWNPSPQHVRNNPYYFVLRTVHFGFVYDMLFAIQVNTSIGIDEVVLKPISIYPNPSNNGLLNIKSETFSEKLTIGIHDVTGKLVFSKIILPNAENLNIQTNLKTGVYVLRLTSNEVDQTFKWIVAD